MSEPRERMIVGSGTPEADWRLWLLTHELPVLAMTGCDRAVVVAPHPDDETLGLGGLIATLLAAGKPVVVVALTDGEASHPHSSTVTPDRLRSRRIAETAAALAVLAAGLPGAIQVQRLQLPDGGLTETPIAEHLGGLLQPTDWCFTTWERDGHPDHEVAGRAARTACERTGARAFGFPVWTWHWAAPGDDRVPWQLAHRLALTPDAHRRKAEAIACYASQTRPLGPAAGDAPVVPPDDLAHFARPDEIVFG